MKMLGIVGGIAPESTIAFYREVVSLFRQRRNDGSYPELIINSVNMTEMLGRIGAGDLDGAADYLSRHIQTLANAGAQFALLASNTPHIVFDELRRRSLIPLLSIVECARDRAIRLGLKRVALLGTRFTMEARFYPDVFAMTGIEVVVPEPDDLEYVHEKYMGEMVHASFREETRAKVLAIIAKMIDTKAIDGVILGGTELPLLLRAGSAHDIPLLDTTKIHAERAVDEMLS